MHSAIRTSAQFRPQLSDLPDDVRPMVATALEPGEKLVHWAPSTGATNHAARIIAFTLLGIVGMFLLIALLTAAPKIVLLALGPMLFGVLALMFAGRASRGPRGTVVTDRRVLSLQGRKLLSIVPAGQLIKATNKQGGGTITVGTNDPKRPGAALAADDIRALEIALLDRFIAPPRALVSDQTAIWWSGVGGQP